MADKYSSTLLPQSNDPTEVQKSVLDLLSKINEVASGTSLGAVTPVAISSSQVSVPAGSSTLLVQGSITSNVTLSFPKADSGLDAYSLILEAYSTNGSKIILSAGTSAVQNIYPPTTAGHILIPVYVDAKGNVYTPTPRYM